MVTIVPSRFQGLKIEDDDDDEPSFSSAAPTSSKSKSPGNKNKKAPKVKKPQKKKKPKQAEPVQPDLEAHDEAIYEKELREALLLSQLEFELTANEQTTVIPEKKLQPAKKKGKPMNLQEFNRSLAPPPTPPLSQSTQQPLTAKVTKEVDFFEQINKQVKTILEREDTQHCISAAAPESTKTVSNKNKKQPTVMSTTDLKIQTLEDENFQLKKEIDSLQIKLRKVTDIVKNAEAKTKIELLRDNERLKKSQIELTGLVENLAVELSQEKSKVSQMLSSSGPGVNKNGILKKNVRFGAYPEVLHYPAEE